VTKSEWKACAALLATFYPHSFKIEGDGDETSAATQRGHAVMQAWFDVLGDLDGMRVLAAIKHMARTQPAFPSVADIVRHAECGNVSAVTAWGEVMKAVGTIGYLGNPDWSDERIGAAVTALGGWQVICQMPTKDAPTARAQFRQAFEAAAEIESRRQTFARLGVATGPDRLAKPSQIGTLLNAEAVIGRSIEEIAKAVPDVSI
jgi:hypothetical protein